jgi:hypothetical protein
VAKVRNEKDRHRKTKPIFVKFDWLRIAFFSEAGAGSREENASKIVQQSAYWRYCWIRVVRNPARPC